MNHGHCTHLLTFPKVCRVNLVALASPIECLLYLPNVWVIQYKLGLDPARKFKCTMATRDWTI